MASGGFQKLPRCTEQQGEECEAGEIKISRSAANPNREFKACTKCRNFMCWVDEENQPKSPKPVAATTSLNTAEEFRKLNQKLDNLYKILNKQ